MGTSIDIAENAENRLQERERAELAAILEYEPFRRSPQLSRLLSYVCEKYFEGRGNEIKEYSIAVEVLGRGSDFDPQIDAIVRVDAYHLRKRLKQYYATDGLDHELQLVLPAGQYTPRFIRRPEADRGALPKDGPLGLGTGAASPAAGTSEADTQLDAPGPGTSDAGSLASGSAAPVVSAAITRTLAKASPEIMPDRQPAVWAPASRSWVAVFAAVVVLMAITALWMLRPGGKAPALPDPAAMVEPPSNGGSAVLEDDTDAVRIMSGARKTNYIDKAGHVWLPDRYFTGGTTFHHEAEIFRTQDPELYNNGREGGFSYKIPLKPGIYELRLYFAETSVRGEGLRGTDVVINGVDAATVDIASDAGGINTATAKIFKNVSPASDGTLTLIFQGTRSSPSSLNAIEIVRNFLEAAGPASDLGLGKMRPIRLTTAEHPFKDHLGHYWFPDSSAYGGRKSTRNAPIEGTADPELYYQQRFGHFSYSIPVVEGGKYTVILHFAETWFGTVNSPGGPGSRVFDVYCNGNTLLRSFDILAHATGNQEVLRAFHGIQASPQGKINLEFTPRTNYALINALEIIEE